MSGFTDHLNFRATLTSRDHSYRTWEQLERAWIGSAGSNAMAAGISDALVRGMNASLIENPSLTSMYRCLRTLQDEIDAWKAAINQAVNREDAAEMRFELSLARGEAEILEDRINARLAVYGC